MDGELQHEGVYYNYVERKVSSDTLYLKCIPNRQKTALYNNLAEYTKKVNDIPSNDKNGTSQKKLSLTYEYVQIHLMYSLAVPDDLLTCHPNPGYTFIPGSFMADFFKPPRHIS